MVIHDGYQPEAVITDSISDALLCNRVKQNTLLLSYLPDPQQIYPLFPFHSIKSILFPFMSFQFFFLSLRISLSVVSQIIFCYLPVSRQIHDPYEIYCSSFCLVVFSKKNLLVHINFSSNSQTTIDGTSDRTDFL